MYIASKQRILGVKRKKRTHVIVIFILLGQKIEVGWLEKQV